MSAAAQLAFDLVGGDAARPTMRMALELVGAPASIGRSLGLMGIAEEEVRRAGDLPPGVFGLLFPGTLVEYADELYRAHARELLERVARGEDTRPGTLAEVIVAMLEVARVAPLREEGQALTEHVFDRLFPGQHGRLFGDSTPMREKWEGQVAGELEHVRRKLAQPTRKLPRIAAAPGAPLGDLISEGLERVAQQTEDTIEDLRGLHAQLLGCPVDELDARWAAEEAQRKADIEAAKAERSGGNLSPGGKSTSRRRGRSEDGGSGRIGASQLTERERELLRHLRVESNVAIYTPTERIPDWNVLKRVMVALGGKWRSRKGFAFPDDVDAQELVRLALETGEILDPRKADFFATPAPLADRVVALADIRPGDRVLEPSAGRGAIALAVRRACPEATVLCIEPLPDNRAALEAEGFELIGSDFLLEGDVFGAFDAIVMNPPFGKRADLVHVEHALRFLRPGGSLVAIMSAGAKYRTDKRGEAFRARVIDELGGRFEDNPDGSFLESGTGVRTVTLVIPRRTA